MIPGLGEKYGVEVEIISKPREAYQSEEYARSGLPVAPALRVGDELIVEGSDISEEQLGEAIRYHLAQSGQAIKTG